MQFCKEHRNIVVLQVCIIVTGYGIIRIKTSDAL
jgi:hypothetical protein